MGLLSRRRHYTDARSIYCPFNIVAKLEDLEWTLAVKKPIHNHELTLAASHPSLRKMAIIDEVKEQIARQFKVQIPPAKILPTL